MKKVQLIGNLGADAKIIEINGHTALSFDLAVTERHKDDTGVWGNFTSWCRVLKWDKREYIEKYLSYYSKGAKVYIEGSYSLTSYKDRPQMSVKVSEMELISSPSKS